MSASHGEPQHDARWWHWEGDQMVCELCPRRCRVRAGQRAFCFVRMGAEDGLKLTTYGRSSGFCVDPIEKKPLFHFLPGTPILSFGTAGCNLGCRFCQNWQISKARETDQLMDEAGPETIAEAARRSGCRAVAFTYNDPVIFAEYALDVAAACRARGVASVAVTAGYITDLARPEFFAGMDAANVDLKAFSEDFYRRMCYGRLEPVKETLRYLVRETPVWTEITTLLIPGENDSEAELDQMTAWIHEALGPDVPIHFTAYHPDYKLARSATPPDTLRRARARARANGLRYVYTGNVRHAEGENTWCPGCGNLLIERDGYLIRGWGLSAAGDCARCGTPIPGRFEAVPGRWGARRLPVRLGGPIPGR